MAEALKFDTKNVAMDSVVSNSGGCDTGERVYRSPGKDNEDKPRRSSRDECTDLEELLDIIQDRTTKMVLREKYLNAELASKEAEIKRLKKELSVQKNSHSDETPIPPTQ